VFIAVINMLSAAHATEHLNDHEIFCQNYEPETCLEHLQSQIASSSVGARKWYQLQSYLLDYLFDKHQFEQLKPLVANLLQQSNHPEVFTTQLYFYQAKLMNSDGNTVEAKRFARLAEQNLQGMYEAFADPMRLLELANLHAVFGEHDIAWNLLLKTESAFLKSKDPVFAFELNTNKALVVHAKGDLAQAVYYRKLAVDAILPTQFHVKISVGLFNLARTEQMLGHYGLAQRYFEQALPYLRPKDEKIRLQYTLIRLAEVCLELQHLEQARSYLKQIDRAVLAKSYQAIYDQLQLQLQ
jgi:tetratricopeptide (TPR) repeat protein